jgi:hypothetical protein
MRFSMRASAFWVPLFRVLGIPRDGAFVDLDPSAGTLRVKQGIWFDETFPLREVADAELSSWPWYGGLGVKLGPGMDTVGVVLSSEGVVAIRFAAPQRMRVLWTVNRTTLRVSLEDPDGFIRALREALGRA